MKRSEAIRIFSEELWLWYKKNKRKLPWRDLTIKNPNQRAYLVLDSEVMLQQTQVSRVVELYKKFIQIFPDLLSLSKASNAEILRAWKGLGYNARALRLRDAAKTIAQKHQGVFPRGLEELQSIKGIGEYTAGAIRNFAFDLPTLCIDVNIRRILHRFFIGMENTDGTFPTSDAKLLKIAEELLAHACPYLPPLFRNGEKEKDRTFWNASGFHSALMDFGSLVCTKYNARWEALSPAMRSMCIAYGKQLKRTNTAKKNEPGRLIAGRFTPERITRGKVVEFLRGQEKAASLSVIGKSVASDWSQKEHEVWMEKILQKLMKNQLIQRPRKGMYML